VVKKRLNRGMGRLHHWFCSLCGAEKG